MNPFRFFLPGEHGYWDHAADARDLSHVETIIYKDLHIQFLDANSERVCGQLYDDTPETARVVLAAATAHLAQFKEWAATHPDDKSALNIYTGSVRVMRSFDYCHFEVTLSSTEPRTLAGVDAMRKEAARLVDKAVVQFQRRKEALSAATGTFCVEHDDGGTSFLTLKDIGEMAKKAQAKPEGERTAEDLAVIKQHGDLLHRANFDYEDEP
jgi:hypothetical protein